jgi:hypothetical protein
MSNVIRIAHADLAGGGFMLTDDEVVELEVRREQIVVEQMAQAGNLSMIYVGEERYEFDFLFNVFYQSTLQKLESIRLLRQTFTLYPFILEEPATAFTVFWPEQPTMTERWVRGRRFAQWDKPITWKESREVLCPPVGGS